MKTPVTTLLIVGMVLTAHLFTGCGSSKDTREPLHLYVSPKGNDDNSGTRKAPFKSFSRARDEIRGMIREGDLPDNGVTVYFREGLYEIQKTIVFKPKDSPPDDIPVTYRAYPGEKPKFTAGQKITNWEKLQEYSPDLPEKAQDHVWVAELLDAREGWHFYTLYQGDKRLPRARSEGFFPTKRQGEPKDRTTLHYPQNAPIKNWPNLQDVEIIIRPNYPFVLNILKPQSVDTENRVVKTTIPATYGMGRCEGWGTKNITGSVWVENVLEVLDEPGEWVLNTDEGLLYYWPEEGKPASNIRAARLQEYIRLEGDEQKGSLVRNICFKGLTFMHGERDTWTSDDIGIQHDWDMYDKGNALFRLRGAENIKVKNCHFTNSGGTGIRLDLHAQHNKITGNHLEYLGGTGILLSGYGPGTKDVNKQNEIVNNHIHHCGQIYWHGIAIFVWQSGANRIANNLIHHIPYDGIVISGIRPSYFSNKGSNRRELYGTIRWDEVGEADTWHTIISFNHARDNLIERNEIHHAIEVLGDGNGIYLSGAPEGNVVRENYLHHIYGGTSAIRADDWQQDTRFEKNIIYKCAWGGILLKLAQHVENNIIVDILDADENPYNLDLWGYVQVKAGPVYDSRIQRNIYYSYDPTVFYYQTTLRGYEHVELTDYAADFNLFYVEKQDEWTRQYLDSLQRMGVEKHSIVADPLFKDPENGDFTLNSNSPAYELGFKPIDMSKIGLLKVASD